MMTSEGYTFYAETIGITMNFADLTDTDFTFQCEFADDACIYWEYDFSIARYGDNYLRHLSRLEVNQLKENCKRILKAIETVQGGLK